MTRCDPPDTPDSAPRRQQIEAIIGACLERRARGEAIDEEALVAAHPELGPELRLELHKLRVIEEARRRAEQGREPEAPISTVQFHSRSFSVRCPHCAAATSVSPETPSGEITCGACGKAFGLVEEASGVGGEDGVRTVGHFKLLEPLGSGSFGTVWKARDTRLDRHVAVKIPHKGHLSAAETEQILREARAAAQLSHPNIIRVHEVGREGDTVYLVSEIVDGVTLSVWLANGPLPSEKAAALAMKIAEALHHAHECGVIHRDLKPGNILISSDGEPHLTDFGLAKREVGESTMTVEGRILGTPAYMSPEQARGEGHRVDRRTDIYSLGVILYQLLTGELPFRGSAQMLVLQILTAEPVSPRRFEASVPRDLETIALKCLEKSPQQRYASAAEVADELRRFLRGDPIQARPVPWIGRAWRWCRRRPLIAGLSAALFLSLLFLAIGGPLAAYRQGGLRKDAEDARQSLEMAIADMYASFGLVASDRGDWAEAVLWFAHAALMARRDAQREAVNVLRARTWSRELPMPRAAFTCKGRPRELLFDRSGRYLLVISADSGCLLWDLKTEAAVGLPLPEGDVSCGAWNPGSSTLALGTRDGSVLLVDLRRTPNVARLAHTGPITAVAFSPDGAQLAVGGKALRVWRLGLAPALVLEALHPAPIVRMRFNRLNDRLATTCADGTARVFNTARDRPSAEPLVAPIASVPSVAPLFLFEGRTLATANPRGMLDFLDLDAGQFISGEREPLDGLGEVRYLAESSGGGLILVGDTREVRVLRVEKADNLVAFTPCRTVRHLNDLTDVAFGPDASMVLTGGIDRMCRLVSVETARAPSPVPTDEHATRHLTDRTLYHQEEVLAVGFSADRQHFATAQADGLIRVWSLPCPGRIQVPIATTASHLEVSPDGRFMVPSGWTGQRELRTVEVYEVATGQPAGPALAHAGLVNGAAFSPDGRLLATFSSLAENAQQRTWQVMQLSHQAGWVEFWEFQAGKRRLAPLRTPSEPMGGAFSPDGALLAVVCAGGEVLWIDPSRGEVVRQTRHEGTARTFAVPWRWAEFSSEGSTFATWGLGPEVYLWDRRTGQVRWVLRGHQGPCRWASFSSEGRLLATASDDKRAIVWDLETGEPAAPPLEHPDWVFSACFSGDGGRLLTASRDHMARLWDWKSATLVCPALEHDDEVFSACFSPDDRWILTSGRDGTARAWEPRTGRPLTPPWTFPGFGYQIRATRDGRFAVVAGTFSALLVADLAELSRSPSTEDQPDSLRLLGEILSGRKVHEGGGTVGMTSSEWQQSWDMWRATSKTR